MAADHRISRAQVQGADQFARLQAIHEAAVECLIQNRLDELSDGMRALTVLFVFAAAIDNGGFAANMYNSTGDHAGEAIKAAETIGADEHAALFRRFAEVGLAGDLAMTQAAREQRLEDMGDEGEEELEELDEAFYALPPIDDLLAAYVEAHPGEFFTD